jgi:hypothetical protein
VDARDQVPVPIAGDIHHDQAVKPCCWRVHPMVRLNHWTFAYDGPELNELFHRDQVDVHGRPRIPHQPPYHLHASAPSSQAGQNH